MPSLSVLSPMALSKTAVCPVLMSCAGLGRCGDRGGSYVLVEDLVREESPTPLGDLAGISAVIHASLHSLKSVSA